MTIFKDKAYKARYTNIGSSDESLVVVSFRDFRHKKSPKCHRLHIKAHEALQIICSKTWRSWLELRRDTLGGAEFIPIDQCDVPRPKLMDDDRFIVIDCGRKVGRLYGYRNPQQENTLYALELDNTFTKHQH